MMVSCIKNKILFPLRVYIVLASVVICAIGADEAYASVCLEPEGSVTAYTTLATAALGYVAPTPFLACKQWLPNEQEGLGIRYLRTVPDPDQDPPNLLCLMYSDSTHNWYYWTRTQGVCPKYYLSVTDGFDSKTSEVNSCTLVGNPIDITSGNKLLNEQDVRLPSGLEFSRRYNSRTTITGSLGSGWTHVFNKRASHETGLIDASSRLSLITAENGAKMASSSLYDTKAAACEVGWTEVRPGLSSFSGTTARYPGSGNSCNILDVGGNVTFIFNIGETVNNAPSMENPVDAMPAVDRLFLQRENGSEISFFNFSGKWINHSGDKGSLTTLTGTGGEQIGWQYKDVEQNVEFYNLRGQLTAIKNPNGNSLSLVYNSEDSLDYVENIYGERLTFGYFPDGKIQSVTDTANRVWMYDYSGENLTRVVNPDFTERTYHYEDIRFPNYLTGVTDERNIRFSTFSYDANGNATTTARAGNANNFTIDYTDPSARKVTNGRDTVTSFHINKRLGVNVISSIDGPGCTACQTGNVSYEYDSQNNVTLTTKFGASTQFGDYNLVGKPGFSKEAPGSLDERLTTYTYNAEFPNLKFRSSNSEKPSII